MLRRAVTRRVVYSALVAAYCLTAAALLFAASTAWGAMLSGYSVAPSSGGGGAASNSFETINAPSGTDPVASSATDTLNFTAGTNLSITGNSGTKTLDFSLGDPSGDCAAGQFLNAIGAGLSLSCGTPSNVTGNAATATALAADPADCSLPNVALGINAAGTAQCNQPSNVTGNAATATALAANGGNCTSGQYAVGVDASGVAECSTTTLTAGTSGNAATATALASDPADCASDRYATAINASGTLTCGQVSLSAGVTGTLPGGNGGTGSTLVSFTGPTLARTFTVPDATTTLCGTNAVCTGYQAGPLTGDVTTSGAAATIGNDKVLEAMLKAVDAPADEECLTYESTGGDFEWQSCGSGGGITGITGGTGGTTTGTTVTLAGGDGTTTTRSTDTVTIATASDETNFLANSASLTCSSSTGKLIVDTTGPTLAFCNASTAYNIAIGNDSDGSAKGLNTGGGSDGSRGITLTDNSSSNPGVGSSGETVIHTKTGIGYVLPYHAAAGPGYQIQASQVALGSNSTQSIASTTLTDLTSISFTVKSGKKYWLQGSLSAAASASSADPTFAVKLSVTTGSPVIAVRGTCSLQTNTATSSFLLTTSDTADDCIIGAAQNVVVMFDGYIYAGADATLTVRGAPAGTGTLTIDAYPLFRLTEFQ